jgi:ABC-type amino acid transport substrate-binding protein
MYPKLLERDPNTGAFSGMYYDLLEELGKQLSLKIEWAEEVGLSTAFDGLAIGRYDVMCFPFAQTTARARVTEFTRPALYFPFFLYARADDARFDSNYAAVNDPSIKIAMLEGEMAQYVAADMFPKAQTVALPNLTDPSQVYLQVALGKADVAMAEPSSIEGFLSHNPGKLKRVAGDSLRMQPTGLDVAVGEERLRNLLDSSIFALQITGSLQRLIDKYTTAPDQFYYPATPWGASSKPAQP